MLETKLDPNKLYEFLKNSQNSYFEECPICKAKLMYSYDIELDCYILKCPNYINDLYKITLRTPDLMEIYKNKAMEKTLTEARVNYEVKAKVKPEPTGIVCKGCGKPMVIRTRSSDGEQFYGCSGFPLCRQTLPITNKDKSK